MRRGIRPVKMTMEEPAGAAYDSPIENRKSKIENSSLRGAVTLICISGSAWLYRVMMRLALKLPSAEPTSASEVLPWVKPITHHSILLIQRPAHGFGHLYAYMACCAGLFALYGAMLAISRGMKNGRLLMLAAAASAVFRGMLLCSPVMLSFDTYAYAFFGRLVEFYGANASAPAPAASLADPFHSNGLYQWGPSWYGPFWTAISAGIAWAGGGHVGLTLLMFRGLAVAASLACGWLIWLIMKRLRPEWAAFGTLLFLWNPVIVAESGLGGHNDSCMMALALMAVWLHVRGCKVGAAAAFTLSLLTKVITAPVLALYVLMVLRESAGWKDRGPFLARAGMAAAALAGLSMLGARVNPSANVAHTVSGADFYKNNYHDLVFTALRRRLGENAATLNAPMNYHPWWAETTSGATKLHADISKKSAIEFRLNARRPLLSLVEKASDGWLRVYDPADRAIGFVDSARIHAIPPPPDAGRDPVVRMLSVAPADWPTVVTANRWIRLTTWGLFAIFGLVAAWQTRDIESFLTWGTATFLAAQLLVMTQMWPWYVNWPLAFGALAPRSAATRLALILSGAQAIHYALLGFCNTTSEWVFDYRSVFTIILPSAVFLIAQVVAMGRWPMRGSSPTSTPSTPSR